MRNVDIMVRPAKKKERQAWKNLLWTETSPLKRGKTGEGQSDSKRSQGLLLLLKKRYGSWLIRRGPGRALRLVGDQRDRADPSKGGGRTDLWGKILIQGEEAHYVLLERKLL